MRKIIVSKKYDKKYLNSFILNEFPNLNKNVLYKALRKKDIRINGVKISQNTLVHFGDEITLYIVDSELDGTYTTIENNNSGNNNSGNNNNNNSTTNPNTPSTPTTPTCTPGTVTVGGELANIFANPESYNSVYSQLSSYFNRSQFDNVTIKIIGDSTSGATPGSFISGIKPGDVLETCTGKTYTITIAK